MRTTRPPRFASGCWTWPPRRVSTGDRRGCSTRPVVGARSLCRSRTAHGGKSREPAAPRPRSKSIQRRLGGFERDPFAAWMSQVFVDSVLRRPLQRGRGVAAAASYACATPSTRRRKVNASISWSAIRLTGGSRSPRSLREKYRRSLFGHANLYGVFTDLGAPLHADGGRDRIRDPDELSLRGVLQGVARSPWQGGAAGEDRLHREAQGRLCRRAAGSVVGHVSTRWRFAFGTGPHHLDRDGWIARRRFRGCIQPASRICASPG